jgi:malonate-semialdehyde dehydrogenase (acetylating)/methylmalonate-semialdehyde dehydrogenase
MKEVLMRTIPHFLKGKTVEGADDLQVFNPATGEVTAHAPIARAALIDETVADARAASLSWRNSSLSLRTNILFTFRQLLVEHADELANIVTEEHGKTLTKTSSTRVVSSNT